MNKLHSRQLSITGLFVIVLIVSMSMVVVRYLRVFDLDASDLARDEDSTTNINRSDVVECRVSIEVASNHTIVWRTTDRRMMEELVLIPLERARENPKPAAYEVIGSLTVQLKNGSDVVYFLFSPWGQVKRGDTYFVADLCELLHVVKASLEDCARDIGETKWD